MKKETRVIKFKRPDDMIIVGGQTIGPWNITPAIYDWLVLMAPAHADHFDVIEAEEEPAKDKSSKPLKA
jgi:hypothetical protein